MTTASSEAIKLRSRHLLGIAGLEADEITLILDTAVAMKEIGGRAIKKVPTLRGRTVVNLFYEPSTRTRTSFEIAEKAPQRRYVEHCHRDLERDQGGIAPRHGPQP
jgi:aspartate carbamoyltransferase catalytic subunit